VYTIDFGDNGDCWAETWYEEGNDLMGKLDEGPVDDLLAVCIREARAEAKGAGDSYCFS